MKKILDYIKIAEKTFPGDNLKIKRYEAELILTEILNINRIDIYIKNDIQISDEDDSKIKRFFERIITHEPIQHILGYTYFRDLKLTVNKDVLIPRPETELLINKALSLLKIDNPTVVDIGTGSGAIALSIAKEIKNANILAVDISNKALKIAQQNSILNKIKNITFKENNLCKNFKEASADMIVANLPYVTEEEYNNLDLIVKNYDPKLALHGGTDGLDLIKTLIVQSTKVLKDNGWILLEIGFKQGIETINLFKQSNCFNNIQILKDYNNLDRIVIAQKITC
jgi:release factor glutamine methyltransferase